MAKKIKIKVSRKIQEELNEIRRELGFKEEPIKDDEYLEALFG